MVASRVMIMETSWVWLVNDGFLNGMGCQVMAGDLPLVEMTQGWFLACLVLDHIGVITSGEDYPSSF